MSVGGLLTAARKRASGRRAARAATTSEVLVPADIRLLVPALAAWTALAVALPWRPVVTATAAGVFLALGLVCLWRFSRGRRRAAAPVLSMAALAALTSGACLLVLLAQGAVRTAGILPALARERAVVTIEGTVTTDPRVVQTQAPAGQPMVVVRLTASSVVGRGYTSQISSPLLVFGDSNLWLALRWGERVSVTGRLTAADPGEEVVALLTPTRAPISRAPPGLVARSAEHLRAGLREAADDLPADARGLLPGLVIGDRSRTPPDLTEAMRATGLTHLDAVSGTNVSLVLAAILGLCRLVGVRRGWRPAVAVAALAGFVVLARPEPSVLRAAAMGAVGLGGLVASRRRVGIPALSGAVLALLCVDPWLARSFGFALSTLATLGLLLFARPWGQWLAGRLPARLGWLGHALAIPLAAQVMCGPLVVVLQGSVQVVGIVANLLAAPLVAPATVLGVSSALTASVSMPAAVLLAWPAGMATQGIAWVARTAADVPMGQLAWPDGAAGAALLASLSVLLLVGAPYLAYLARSHRLSALAAVAVVLAGGWPTAALTWPPTGWALVACDVGQGDGLVLSSGPGRAVLVDVGADPDAIDRCLSSLGVTRVDAVVLTHFHADHVDGLPGVLRGRVVGQLLTSPVRDPPFQAEEVRRWAATAGVPEHPVVAGDEARWGRVHVDVLWPARVLHDGSVANNASVVLAAEIGDLRVLLLGDVETAAAHQVLLVLRRDSAYGVRRTFDVLKVAHHGSRLQDDALVHTVGAPLAVVSVGADNTYGHPSSATLELLRESGSRVLRTDRDGDISVGRSPAGMLEVTTSKR